MPLLLCAYIFLLMSYAISVTHRAEIKHDDLAQAIFCVNRSTVSSSYAQMTFDSIVRGVCFYA